MIYNFYKSENLDNLLKLLIKKGRNENYTISVICKNLEKANNISQFLWNAFECIPHWVNGDPYFENNNVFIDDVQHKADMLIVLEDSSFDLDNFEYKKVMFVGNFHRLDGNYWKYKNNEWKKLTFDQFFS